MKATLLRNYRKPETGNTVYVHAVTGTADELEAYKEAQGDNFKVDEEDGTVLWFSTRYHGDEVTLAISRNGKVFADTSEFDKANSLCEQYKDTALGEHLARVMAEKLLANLGGRKPSAPVAKQSNSDLSSL